jgi:hypothetical protein
VMAASSAAMRDFRRDIAFLIADADNHEIILRLDVVFGLELGDAGVGGWLVSLVDQEVAAGGRQDGFEFFEPAAQCVSHSASPCSGPQELLA